MIKTSFLKTQKEDCFLNLKYLNRKNIEEEMIDKKFNPQISPPFKKGSKWQELANFISRKNRDISIIKDIEKDPALKKIHTQRDKIFSKIFKQN